jgi:sterol desaturase/sphingolipid hydroxylase (fatty acid hydroxylase superfamily)
LPIPLEPRAHSEIPLILSLTNRLCVTLQAMTKVIKDTCALCKQLVSFTPSQQFFFLDFYAFPPIILGLSYLSLYSPRPSGLLFVAGLLGWTLVEYVVHRFLLHRVLFFMRLHDIHHRNQTKLVGTPTLLSVTLILLLVFLPLAFYLGSVTASGLTAGFSFGYILYALVHHWLHHWPSRGVRLLRWLKKLHALHHRSGSTSNFGVTSPVWDVVFQTLLIKPTIADKAQRAIKSKVDGI